MVLAKELALTDGLRDARMISPALEAYERTRAPRCAKVVLDSRRRGRMYLWTLKPVVSMRNRAPRRLPAPVTKLMLKQRINYQV